MSRIDERQEPLFDDDDKGEARTALKKIVIKALTDHKITYAEFSRRYGSYYMQQGLSKEKIQSSRNNLLKSLKIQNDISYDKFAQVFRVILRLNLIKVDMTFMDEDGKEKQIVTELRKF